MKWICLLAGVLALNAAQAAELYRWVDKDGVVHYSETPHLDAEKLRIGSSPAGTASEVEDATLPFDVRLAHKNFPVTLYVFNPCDDSCNFARNFLKKRRVPFSEVTLKTKEDVDNFKQQSGTDMVPTLSVGHAWLKGFQPNDWNNELDSAGYPK
jgi:glutaredoxin